MTARDERSAGARISWAAGSLVVAASAVVVAAGCVSRAPEPSAPVVAPSIADAETPAPSEPAVAAETPKPAPVVAEPTYRTITWDDISRFAYPWPDENAVAANANGPEIPADVRAMSGKRFTIEGYAVPLDYDDGVIRKFVVLATPMGGYASAPPMNRWIVASNDAKTKFDCRRFDTVRVSGVLDVGEEMREGYVVGIYRMKAEKIEVVPAPPPPPPPPTRVASKTAAAAYASVSWADLSNYEYAPPGSAARAANGGACAIPADVLALSGKRVAIEGYAAAWLQGAKLIVFAEPSKPGPSPPMSLWMTVSIDDLPEFDYYRSGRIRLCGVLDVGEEMLMGHVVGLYRMKAEAVELVKR